MPTRFRTSTALLRSFFSFLFLLAMGTTPLFAQISFNDFSTGNGLALNGTPQVWTPQVGEASGNVLRLTPDNLNHVSGSAWFITPQSVAQGFTSAFQFKISHLNNDFLGPADGFAFVIQNSSGEGLGTAALGGSGGAIGYGVPDPEDTGTPIPNSLAVEFDTYQNPWDPNANHIAVQSCGTAPNSQDHTGICNLGIVSDLGGIVLADNAVHNAIVEYDPPSGETPGTLRVFLDNSGTPILTVNTDLSALLSLGGDGNTTALVGFTGATGGFVENNDILSWTFTPANAQTQITQDLVAGNPAPTDTNYVFGSYNHKLEYVNAGSDIVTVTAIPIDQLTFHNTRLLGSNFPNADCAIYEGTGGLCVLFRVTCDGSPDCTTLDYTLFNNFNTQDTITGAGQLKATIGENDWQNIIQSFTQTRNDPGGTGKTKGFSDFILCQNCTAAPTIQISSPPNGGFVALGQSVPITFTCTTDPKAPNVTLVPNPCAGTIGVTTVHSGDTFVFNQLGPASMTVTAGDSVGNSSLATSSFIVGQPPAITSVNNATFQLGVAGSFTVTTTGSPTPSITEAGALPGGVTFVDNHNGTGTLSGTPTASGSFYICFTAHNGVNPDAIQNFTLTVTGPQLSVTPTSINFGNVYLYSLLAKNVTLTNTGNVNVLISKVSVILGQADKDDYFFVNFCGSTIKPGKSCVITVFLWADDLGTRTATLNIADNAQGSPQQVSLTANVIKKKGH